jgi:hypothetical protein
VPTGITEQTGPRVTKQFDYREQGARHDLAASESAEVQEDIFMKTCNLICAGCNLDSRRRASHQQLTNATM